MYSDMDDIEHKKAGIIKLIILSNDPTIFISYTKNGDGENERVECHCLPNKIIFSISVLNLTCKKIQIYRRRVNSRDSYHTGSFEDESDAKKILCNYISKVQRISFI